MKLTFALTFSEAVFIAFASFEIKFIACSLFFLVAAPNKN